MSELQSQIEAIYHADYIRNTEALGNIAYWEDRVHFIANNAAPVIRALCAEKERYEAKYARLQAGVLALQKAMSDLVTLATPAGSSITCSDMIKALTAMVQVTVLMKKGL